MEPAAPPLPPADAPPPPATGWLRNRLDADQRTYFRVTRTATYSFIIAVPLLVLYEVLILLVNQGDLQQVRVGADLWMKQLLAMLGGTGSLALSLAVLAVGVGVFIAERKKKIPLRGKYFGWMLVESFAWGLVLLLTIGWFTGLIFSMAPALALAATQATQQIDTMTMLALSLGAGLYEELVFRVLLVGGLAWSLHRLMGLPQRRAYIAAALVGALLFSAVHYMGSLGDPFAWSSFTFRFLFGLALNGLFLWRGFGIAAWAHALYDVVVVLMQA